MARLRSVAVVALLWLAAFAGSSAPDGFGGPRQAEMPLVAGAVGRSASVAEALAGTRAGRGWAIASDPAGKRWEVGHGRDGKRWEVG